MDKSDDAKIVDLVALSEEVSFCSKPCKST
jgi:hypothetical protein